MIELGLGYEHGSVHVECLDDEFTVEIHWDALVQAVDDLRVIFLHD